MPDTQFFNLSTFKPQSSAKLLKNWWAPDTNQVAVGGYGGFKVRVVNTSISDFEFNLLSPEGDRESKNLKVDLADLAHVWAGHSSAIYANPGECGYLLLSKAYLEFAKVTNPLDFSDGKGKWPFGADLWAGLIENLMRRNGAVLGPDAAQAGRVLVNALKAKKNELR
ncbi:hypothetical protein OWM54_10890 [Myxococcus sp. MISCRS1]|uniref:hypothetical protein n=1 Tax=Myxococcus sp. MISCRS1 TaxID=2996786 RepID=UPI00226F98D9|nr:hypothetical protein [Myxococcus sp. MISCRS1]MCY0997643.1 hypothetical protein [Myxococcus sp. MISCRS1]